MQIVMKIYGFCSVRLIKKSVISENSPVIIVSFFKNLSHTLDVKQLKRLLVLSKKILVIV